MPDNLAYVSLASHHQIGITITVDVSGKNSTCEAGSVCQMHFETIITV